MTLWQTQIMEEQAAMEQWEEMHEPDPDEGRKFDAKISLDICLQHLSKVRDFIEEAADEINGLPDENVILSYLSDIDEMTSGLRIIQNSLLGRD